MLPLLIVGPILQTDRLDHGGESEVQRCKEKISAITAALKAMDTTPIVIVRSALFEEYPGTEVWDVVKQHSLLLLIITNSPSEDGLGFILKGCAGLLPADISGPELRDLLPRVAGGEIWAPPLLLSRALRHVLRTEAQAPLTAREQQVFELVARGMTNRHIAEKLCVTRETVRWHLRGINTKLGKSVIQRLRSETDRASGDGILSDERE